MRKGSRLVSAWMHYFFAYFFASSDGDTSKPRAVKVLKTETTRTPFPQAINTPLNHLRPSRLSLSLYDEEDLQSKGIVVGSVLGEG